MCGTLAILGAFLAALVPTPAVARDFQDFGLSNLQEVGQELFGSHFEWARGWLHQKDLAVVAVNNLTKPTLSIPCFNVTIPIINKMVFDLVEPCGTIHVPADGITFTTPFGSYHVAGIKTVDHELQGVDNAFSGYTAWAVGAVAMVYVIYKRQMVKKQLANMCTGSLGREEQDPYAPAEELAQKEKDEHDINSDKFLCPGNIYRLVTVLHPGVVGYSEWGGYCFKALICAYMQLYLPLNIMRHCFRMWHFNGIKSPLYFAMNFTSFFMQYAALANVCTLFASRCVNVIETDASACYFLASHDPEPEPAATSEPGKGSSKVAPLLESGGVPSAADAKAAAKAAAKAELKNLEKKITPPQWLVNWNETLWVFINLFVSCASSVMLMIAMFMKVATFTGDIINIALITVSLYFVFDLDDKIMDSDPKLRPHYRREVLKQMVKTEKDPKWIKRMASVTVGVIRASVSLGLLMIILVSWRQVLDLAGKPIHGGEKPTIIGGDPFHQ